MNDQERPEDGTNLDPVAAQIHVADIEVDEPVTDELEEQEASLEEEFSDEELAEDDEDEFEDEEELEAARSMIDELFDEDDLGEVMSELDVLTLEDAAAYLKVEYGQIRRLVKEQGLPGRKIGEEWRFLRGAIADWLSEPTTIAAVPAAAPAPVQEKRHEFIARPPLKERFAQGADQDRPPRFPQQGGSRYPQQGQGNTRYPQQGGQQENRPPRRQHNEGGYQGGGHNQGGNQYQGGNQNQGGNRNQEGYPPPRRPNYGNDQGQQFPQGEYRPPRRGNFENQGAGGGGGQFSGGQFSGARKFGGPKKPKRKALNEQRFKRLDRRKFDGEEGGAAPQDSQD